MVTAPPTQEKLHAALTAAGRAHHEYETNALNGERDEQWPGWYAAYVLGRLGDFTPPSLLAKWLEEAPPGDNWAPFAAAAVLTEIEKLT